jgi:peptide deformylase
MSTVIPVSTLDAVNAALSSGDLSFEIIIEAQTPAVDWVADPQRFAEENAELLLEFRKFAVANGNAVGLAANQVSLNGVHLLLPFFVMLDVGVARWRTMINPAIDAAEGSPQEMLEECLSWPGEKLAALRFPGITASYCDENGALRQEREMKGLGAQIFQHEIDHLKGVPERIVSRDYFTARNEGPQVGRNEPCPCGSGKKYKKCCL